MPARLDLIGIIVRDMKASLDFYRALGLNIPAAQDKEGHVEHVLPNGLRVAWDTHEVINSFDPDWSPPSGHHRMGMAFLCDSPAEVDAIYAQMMNSGYHGHKPPFSAPWGQRYAQVEDPDGNVVDLFAPDPG